LQEEFLATAPCTDLRLVGGAQVTSPGVSMAGVAIPGSSNYDMETESECARVKGNMESGSHKRERNEESASEMSDTENRFGQEEKKKKYESKEGSENEGVNGRKRLLFPQNCAMNFMEKLRWAMQLGRDHRGFEPLLKEGRGRPYLTVRAGQAEQTLTTQGYKGTVMTVPKGGEKLTKVIIFQYPIVLDPEYLLDDERFVWVKRNESRGEERSQLVALVKGEVPERVFISGAGYRRVAPYVEPPVMCLKCCRWGHKSWKCQQDARCRFCGKKHDSRICRAKIEKGDRIKPCCCNCGGSHNAGSLACRARPQWKVTSAVPHQGVAEEAPREAGPVTMQAEVPRETAAPVPNAWLQGPPAVVPKEDKRPQEQHQTQEVPRNNDGEAISALTQMMQAMIKRMDALEKRLAEKEQKKEEETEKEINSENISGLARETNLERKITIKGKERTIKSSIVEGTSSEVFRSVLLKCKDPEKETLLKKWEIMQELWGTIQKVVEKHKDTIKT